MAIRPAHRDHAVRPGLVCCRRSADDLLQHDRWSPVRQPAIFVTVACGCATGECLSRRVSSWTRGSTAGRSSWRSAGARCRDHAAQQGLASRMPAPSPCCPVHGKRSGPSQPPRASGQNCRPPPRNDLRTRDHHIATVSSATEWRLHHARVRRHPAILWPRSTEQARQGCRFADRAELIALQPGAALSGSGPTVPSYCVV